jgi:hypothetical protein
VGHLEKNGFVVKSEDLSQRQLVAVKHRHGIPSRLHSCHTGVIDNYVIEGHVPAAVITRLLTEKPDVVGLAVPGMPIGSPGMEGPHPQTYRVFSFDREGHIQVYDRIDPHG